MAGALVAVAVLIALTSWNRATGAFGNSDEGLNSSVWAMCSRALRDDPIGSAMGGQRLDGLEYANHPPLLCTTAAAAELVAGEHEWSTRAPAWIATIALLPLTYLMLRRARFEPLTAGAGTVVAIGTPMVVVYGSMLDTPVVGLPFAAAVAAAWAGEWPAGDDPPRPWPAAAVGALAAGAALASWQAGLGAALGGAALLVWGADRRRAIPYLVGWAAGAATSLAWAAWTYGTFTDLLDKLDTRTTGSVGLAESLSFQLDWLRILLGVSLFALVACAVALRDRALRPLAGLLLLTGAIWSVVFHGGAGGHQYWNYFLLLPTALGGAYALAGLARWLDAGHGPRVPGGLAALGVAGLLAVIQVSSPTLAERLIDDGLPAGELLRAADLPPSGELPVVGDEVRVYAMVIYSTGLTPIDVADRDALADIAARDPERLVLVVRPCSNDEPTDLCWDLPDPDSSRTELVGAAELLEELR